jgi:hypothetical protein
LNFFGHAVVAGWADGRAELTLGSMLPDFEAMTRVPLIEVRDAEIQRGIDLHHRTDDAFHRTAAFLSWNASALDALAAAGVRRGTARAVSHIAAEMFLDGWLAAQPVLAHGYLAALDVDANGRLRWKDGGEAYEKLHLRLSAWGTPLDYAEPSFVLGRLRDALRQRPALAIADEEREAIAALLPSLKHRVQREARELLQELRDALGWSD